MLELKEISKSYKTASFSQTALDNINIKFRSNEFVAILGASGSGKTTMLNIIGGLDKYDSGDLIINNSSTKTFKNKDWDAYRNNCIGFIFQSYNLIPHISILENVEMGMTLSGISKSQRRNKANEVLTKVGLQDHIHKRPNQMSGGQMQRVAIARALANDPDIILADEPTGALDSTTSVQIMELIKEIAKDKLVIMVTHNPELAHEYASRIIELKDGKVISDNNKLETFSETSKLFNIKKTAMNYFTALKLSFNNIKTKKGRTLLTSFASSIGIIGIALILSLSNGFQIKIDEFEHDSLSEMPIMISEQAINLDTDSIKATKKHSKYSENKEVYALKDMKETMTHTNVITDEYVDYIKKLDQKLVSGISYTKAVNFNMIVKNDDNSYEQISSTNQGVSWTLLPTKSTGNKYESITTNYDILAGEINDNEPGLILQVDSRNQVSESTLKQIGINDASKVSFKDIMNKEIKVILNNDYYQNINGYFIPSQDFESLYKNSTFTIKVQAIIRGKEDKETITSGSGFGYTSSLSDKIINSNKDSEIVKAQENSDVNILTGQSFDEKSTKKLMLAYLGSDSTPVAINIFPHDFDSKDKIINYLDKYNKNKSKEDQIKYTDMAALISSLSGDIMSAITIVLIAFSAISLIVSSIMIGIITYISVLERTKEIGILRALGARKKDITRVFNAETIIIGLCSGLIGIIIAYLLTIPANIIIEEMSGLPNVAKLNPVHALILIIISIVLTLIGGFIPAKIAAKKDPVEALRSE